MEMIFKDIDEFDRKYNEATGEDLYQVQCDCGRCYEMDLDDVGISIGNFHIEIPECPIMRCENCWTAKLCPMIPREIHKTYECMAANGNNACRLSFKNDIRFEWAKEAEYQYDSRDLFIPGLDIDLDPMHPRGYSCPVFFNRKVLGSFYNDSDYELDFFSESYGSIAKRGTDGWDYEWLVCFGINKNNRVVMFLGDLDDIDIDDPAIHWLQSYNITSDHTIVDTELYRAQLHCKPSKPIVELRILALKDSFYKRIKDKYGVDISHLQDVCEEQKKGLQKPLNYTEKEIGANIDLMDRLLNEGINVKGLRKLYKVLYNKVPDEEIATKTRKLLEEIIRKNDENASRIIGPLYSLNDLRNYFSHLLSKSKMEDLKGGVLNTLGLSDFQDYRKLYDTLMQRLYEFYQYLNITDL